MKLDQIIPDEKIRKSIYAVFGVIGIALSVIQTVYGSLEMAQPAWLTASFAAYGVLAAAGFSLSTANTSVTFSGRASKSEPEAPFTLEDLHAAGVRVVDGDQPLAGFEEPVQVPTAGVDPASTAKHA